MNRSKSIAVLLLVAMPGNAFAQIIAPDARAAAFRDRLSRASILDTWDPGAYGSALVKQAASCDSSRSEGRNDATDQHGSAGWFLGGVGAGVALGLIGTGAIVGGSALTNPQPRATKAGQDEACYRDG